MGARDQARAAAAESEEVTELAVGCSLTIPTGTHFQFRCNGAAPLEAVAVTMPPWPGDDETYAVPGPWPEAKAAGEEA